jgi:hypothetical protein
MDLLQAIEQAETDLQNTLDQLLEARALVETLTADSKKMRVELAGLTAFAHRKGLSEEPETTAVGASAEVVPISPDINLTPEDKLDLVLMSRTDAVLAVMASHAQPVDRATIHEGFFEGGRFDDLDEVSLTLSGLKRSGRVEKLGQGLWQVAEEAVTAELG